MSDFKVEFELLMKDMATKELQRFKQELNNTTGASGAFNKNIGDGEKLLRNFYQEQRLQDRTMREATQSLMGFTVGMSGLLMSGGEASKGVKDLNKTILSSVTAMQGAEFAAASLGIAGRNLGGTMGKIASTLSANAGYIGGMVAAGVATIGLAKVLADWLHPALTTAEVKIKSLNTSTGNLLTAFKAFQNNEKYKAELEKFIKDFEAQNTLQTRMMQVAGATKGQIEAMLAERTQEFKIAKQELEKLVGKVQGEPKKGNEKGSTTGGDTLKEQFEAEKQMRRAMANWKMDLMAEEEQKKIEAATREQERLLNYQQTAFTIFQAVGAALGNSLAGQDATARQILKSIANMFITMAEAAMFAATAMANAKGIATFFTSMIADGPALLAGFAALETARAVINSFHQGGTVGDFQGQPAAREFPIMVRGGETVRTEGQERDLINSKGSKGTVVNININGKGLIPRDIQKAVQMGMRQTGLTVDKYFVNQRSKIVFE